MGMLVRLLAYGVAVLVLFLLAFPDWKGTSYHPFSLCLISSGAVLMFAFLQAFKVDSLMVTVVYEAGFVLAVTMYFLYTWPSSRPPLQLLGQGYRPNRAQARQGLKRLGLDPDSAAAWPVLAAFPKR
ncbi:MAG: hypothetical protein HY927_04260 [Elusimicrobia bacterium]|nr:hypothetical protein [Elusimicrobiota bacterium]